MGNRVLTANCIEICGRYFVVIEVCVYPTDVPMLILAALWLLNAPERTRPVMASNTTTLWSD